MTDEFDIFKPLRESLTDSMNRLPFVTWDRLIVGETHVMVYGWIARDDGRSDFALIRAPLDDSDGGEFVTSSARLDPMISEILNTGGVAGEGHPCRRVEAWMPDVKYAAKESA